MEIFLGSMVAVALPPFLLIISIIGLAKSPKQWRYFSVGYIICIAMLAYNWIPQSTPDITRYFYMLKQCATMSLSETNEFFDDGLFIKNFIFWMIGHLGDVHLLPAISTGTVYASATYITCSYCENESRVKDIPIVMLFQFLTLPFFSITSNIRNVWCFSLIMLAAYRELYLKKKDMLTLCMYILPCFIHSGGWVLIGIRLICMLARRFRFIAIMIAFGVAQIINYLYGIISYIPNKMVTEMVIVAYKYLNETNSVYALSVASNIGDKLSRYSAMILAIFFMVYTFIRIRGWKAETTFSVYEFLVASSVIGFNAFTVPHYWRLSVALTVGAAPIISMMIKDFQEKRKYYRYWMIAVFLTAFMQFFVQIKITSGLVDYAQILTDFSINSIYCVLIRIIIGMFTWT